MGSLSEVNILGAVGALLLMLYVAVDMPPAVQAGPGSTVTLRYARWWRVYLLLLAFAVPLAITLLARVRPPRHEEETNPLLRLFALFCGLSLPMWWATTNFSLTISPEGLVCGSPWRGKRFVPWGDLVEVRHGMVVQWYVLRTRGGYCFRVPCECVPGLPLFLEAVARHPHVRLVR
jgi:hypothetical protein